MPNINWEEEYEKDKKSSLEEMSQLLTQEHLDEDGYPTESALRLIQIWRADDSAGWFEFINSIWHLRSWGWHEEVVDSEWDTEKKVTKYHISTAGWSGNESIIRAMKKNWILWPTTWVQSRRGGHYIFERDND